MDLALAPRKSGGMESLIPIVNKLRDVFQRAGSSPGTVQLPQIVVVGSQSSGKSSVLEGLVRKQFLPRGDGIVTRCPIVLMLIHTPGDKEWVEFDHLPGEKISDFSLVEEEIRKKTAELAGGNLFISATQIKLKVLSPNFLTLTVVDLPGIVKIPVGDQPPDIEAQTVDLVKQYITQRNSIILAVTEGSVNIANSDSLKLAKEVDPTEERTIAVVTKADLAEGDDFKALIMGKSVQLKLGLVAVINRSKSHIDSNMSFENVVDEEQSFFQRQYPQVAKNHGTPYLAKRLKIID